jgi:hypothetical protein
MFGVTKFLRLSISSKFSSEFSSSRSIFSDALESKIIPGVTVGWKLGGMLTRPSPIVGSFLNYSGCFFVDS